MRRSARRAPLIFPLTLVLVGLVILLNNFLLIEANIVQYWPLVFILIGLQLLWRGDLAPSWEAQSFGITRGSVETASLEISSGEVDVRLHSLDRAGRLIAGQYTARSRPRLGVRQNHAALTMYRGQTWLFSLADWHVNLAQDVPWRLLISSHLGAQDLDLRDLQIRHAHIATGIGNIRLIAPDRAIGPLYVRSTFGDIYIAIPDDVPVYLTIQASPFCKVILGDTDLAPHEDAPAIYTNPLYDPDQAALEMTVVATFGNIIVADIRPESDEAT